MGLFKRKKGKLSKNQFFVIARVVSRYWCGDHVVHDSHWYPTIEQTVENEVSINICPGYK